MHPHNDRGTAVAAAELAQLAGADRVEGLPLRQRRAHRQRGSRDPRPQHGPRASIRASISRTSTTSPAWPRRAPSCRSTRATRMWRSRLHGLLGFAPGRDQKGLGCSSRVPNGRCRTCPSTHDVGRTYDSVIRVNSQSGKGGVAHLLQAHWQPHDAAADAGGVQRGSAAPHRRDRPGSGRPSVVDALRS